MFLQQLWSDQSMSRAAMNLLPLLQPATAVLKQVLHQNSSHLGSGKSQQINILQKVAKRIFGNFLRVKA